MFELEIRKAINPKSCDLPPPEIVSYRYLTSMLSLLPTSVSNTVMNFMNVSELYTHLLLDNPNVNFNRVYYQYLMYLKDIYGTVNDKTLEYIANVCGLNPEHNWKELDKRSHLMNIAIDGDMFWEYIIWDAPFVINLLLSIENNDGLMLENYVELFRCDQTDYVFHIIDYLLRYAYDMNRTNIISNILQSFTPILCNDKNYNRVDNMMGRFMKYVNHKMTNFEFHNMVQDTMSPSELVSQLEAYFGDELYQFYSINWTWYVYHMAKHDDLAGLMAIASKLEKPYQPLDYEIVIYALVKDKEDIYRVLIEEFDWVDNRNSTERSFFTGVSRSDLEKTIIYLMRNMTSRRNFDIERGFDASFKCFQSAFNMESMSSSGYGSVYGMGERRFHLTIYTKSLPVRSEVMQKWNETANTHENIVTNIGNDISAKADFNNGIIHFMTHKLNKAVRSYDKGHRDTDNISSLVGAYVDSCGMLYTPCHKNHPHILTL